MSAPIWSVRGRAAFAAFARSRRCRRGAVTVSYVPSAAQEPPRAAFAVSRAVGGAVARNRVRRRLRSALREHRELLRPGGYLVSVGPAALRTTYSDLSATLREILTELGAAKGLPSPARPTVSG